MKVKEFFKREKRKGNKLELSREEWDSLKLKLTIRQELKRKLKAELDRKAYYSPNRFFQYLRHKTVYMDVVEAGLLANHLNKSAINKSRVKLVETLDKKVKGIDPKQEQIEILQHMISINREAIALVSSIY